MRSRESGVLRPLDSGPNAFAVSGRFFAIALDIHNKEGSGWPVLRGQASQRYICSIIEAVVAPL
jgi:hypothetical protein